LKTLQLGNSTIKSERNVEDKPSSDSIDWKLPGTSINIPLDPKSKFHPETNLDDTARRTPTESRQLGTKRQTVTFENTSIPGTDELQKSPASPSEMKPKPRRKEHRKSMGNTLDVNLSVVDCMSKLNPDAGMIIPCGEKSHNRIRSRADLDISPVASANKKGQLIKFSGGAKNDLN
jgi:hypothetical protein